MKTALLARYDDASLCLMNKEAAEVYATAYIGAWLVQTSKNGNPVFTKVQEVFLHPLTNTSGQVIACTKVQKGMNSSKKRGR